MQSFSPIIKKSKGPMHSCLKIRSMHNLAHLRVFNHCNLTVSPSSTHVRGWETTNFGALLLTIDDLFMNEFGGN